MSAEQVALDSLSAATAWRSMKTGRDSFSSVAENLAPQTFRFDLPSLQAPPLAPIKDDLESSFSWNDPSFGVQA